MKSYTNLKQSKILADILPLESADMYWDLLSKDKYAKVNNIGHCLGRTCVYAWSLVALLGVLSDYTLKSNKFYGKVALWCQGISVECDTPVDACYEMIIKLHELNLL